MERSKYVFSPPEKSKAEIAAGIWLPDDNDICNRCVGVLRAWWPRAAAYNDTARLWTLDADGRLAKDGSLADALRAEYLMKLAELMAESDRRTRANREAFISGAIPPGYLVEINRAKLKNPAAFDKVQAWTPGGDLPGLVALGDTGRGKTLAVYHRLATLHRETGVTFSALTADELKRRIIASALRESDGNTEDAADDVETKLRKAKIIFVDDLSQTKLTAHYAERLFAIVEYRMARRLPCVFTVQMGKAALVHKLAGYEAAFLDTADCLARRIEDCCQPVNFGRNDPPSRC